MRQPRHIILWRLPGDGIGDNLFITAVAREVHKHDPKIKITVVAKYEELFRNNPHISAFRRHVARVWRSRYRDMLRKVPLPFHYYYMDYQLHRGCQHIITQMCRVVLAPDYNPDISVEIFLEDRELEEIRPLLPPGPFVTIQSAGKTTFTSNKEWFPERFQAVVDAFPSIRFVQLGLPSDPPLARCLDLRGKLTLRQVAAVLKLARMNVCQVGGLMHLAAAAGIPSVVVYGGFEHPEMSGYPFNRSLVNQPTCSPCYPASTCPYDRKCMADISADQVVAAIRQLI